MVENDIAVSREGVGHVMLVDDDRMVREFVQRALRMDGHKITTCANGLEAVEFYSRYHDDVDIIVLDMIMPVMDGLTAFKEIRRINPAAKVIIASAYAVDGIISQCMAAGALELITKPFDMDHIRTAVKKHLSAEAPPP